MSGAHDGVPPDSERRLRKIWALRQLHSVVLLVALLALYFFSQRLGHFLIERVTLYGLIVWPFFAIAIAWWDRHWVWKHQVRLLGLSEQGRKQ